MVEVTQDERLEVGCILSEQAEIMNYKKRGKNIN